MPSMRWRYAAFGGAVGVVLIVKVARRRLSRWKDQALVDKKANQIAVVGDTFVDIVAGPLEEMPTFGGDALVPQPIRLLLGGSAANTALQMCHLMRSGLITPPDAGDSCVLHSTTGGDELGSLARRHLAAAEVPLSEVRRAPHQGTCICFTGPSDRGFVTFRGSVATFSRADIDMPRLLAASHVHIAGHFNTPALWPDLAELLAAARKRGATTSLGPQYDATGQWQGLDEMYPLLDVLLPNEAEARHLSGRQDLNDAAAFFLARGVELVVITRGSGGALAAAARAAAHSGAGGFGGGGGDGLCFWEQACRPVTVVDTTGAGDSFAAGFLYAWKATGDVPAALSWGCAMGTAACTKFGASETATKQELLDYRIPPPLPVALAPSGSAEPPRASGP